MPSGIRLPRGNDCRGFGHGPCARRHIASHDRVGADQCIIADGDLAQHHRAGADFVLSYTTLGIEAVMSFLRGREPVLLGEGVGLFAVAVPPSLAGRPLGESGIGSKTGLSVVALDVNGRLTTPLTAATILREGASLLMLGSQDQRKQFAEAFEHKEK